MRAPTSALPMPIRAGACCKKLQTAIGGRSTWTLLPLGLTIIWGNVLFSLGQNQQAVTNFCQALHFCPDFAEAHYNLAIALQAQQMPDQAIQHYRQAIELNIDYLEARINLGAALLAQGHWDEAVLHFQYVLKIVPDDLFAHINLGNAFRIQGDHTQAIKHYQRALAIKPDCTPAQRGLTLALQAQSQSGTPAQNRQYQTPAQE